MADQKKISSILLSSNREVNVDLLPLAILFEGGQSGVQISGRSRTETFQLPFCTACDTMLTLHNAISLQTPIQCGTHLRGAALQRLTSRRDRLRHIRIDGYHRQYRAVKEEQGTCDREHPRKDLYGYKTLRLLPQTTTSRFTNVQPLRACLCAEKTEVGEQESDKSRSDRAVHSAGIAASGRALFRSAS